jgi:predicted lipoprotein with Yx(FWY)xxD motif
MSQVFKSFAVFAACAALVSAAGCGSSNGEQPTVQNSVTTRGATVTSKPSSIGTILADASGRTLYVFSADSDGKSACTAACPGAWPPATASGGVTATGEVQQDKLGLMTIDGGAKQITYDGKPLYTYVKDRKKKDVKGQGQNSFGGDWSAIRPNGDKAG